MKFAYRIRFHFCKDNRISSDRVSEEFAINGQPFRLESANGNSLKESDAVVLSSRGFDTESEALVHGEKIKKCLSLCGAMLRHGIDVGKEKTLSWASRPLIEIFEEQGAQLINDVHGLTVYSDDIETKLITGFPLRITVSSQPEQFVSALETAYNLSPELGEKEKIAFDLYNSSFFETSKNARFLTLISVVETLSEPDQEKQDVIELIDELITHLKESALDKTEKMIVASRLGSLKRKSISASARQLIQKYLNKEEAGIYGNFYTIRSGLLHDGNLRCKENEFREKLSQLNDMVSRLLIEIMESKAITYERTPNR